MLEFQTEVVVIGNGPAGLSLSSFLSGWHPYTTGHPDAFIDEHLQRNVSLLEQDLSWYLPEHELNAGPSQTMYSSFFDRLVRPTTSEKHNCLEYVYREECAVDHVVLGDGLIGGSWNGYDANMSIISLSSWMNLPGYSLSNWTNNQPLPARLPSKFILEYFRAYAKHMGVEKNFMENTTVTNVSKVSLDETQEACWSVQGFGVNGIRFSILCKKVVLASGRNEQRMLGVEGELNASSIAYDCQEMKHLLNRELCSKLKNSRIKPVVVIGDGISAADIVNCCLTNNLKVVHVFRRSVQQLKTTMLARLSSTVYPEYSRIFGLMIGRSTHPLYERLSESSIQKVYPNKRIEINGPQHRQLDYRCLAVCIGLQANMLFMEEKHEFLADYQSYQDPTLFAIGSVAGDHFVRYLIGGAFRVAQKLVFERNKHPKIPFVSCCCLIDMNANNICQQSV